MPSKSHLTSSIVGVWYASIWLLILASVIYGFARGHALTFLAVAGSLGTLIVFSILAMRFATQLFACLALTTLVLPLYMFEVYLALTIDKSKVGHVAKLREQGLTAYPALFPSGFLYLSQKDGGESRSPIMIDGREILPLAGIPNVLTVYCRMAHVSWVTYHSDALGFRGPTIAERSGAPEFALLGDSFVQGFCVPDALTYATQISALGPTASYGMNGTSVLAQRAIYREYVKAARPRHIVWFFYEGNDLHDYLAERTWPLLRAYLDPTHTQDLAEINGVLSVALRRFIDQQMASEDVATVVHDWHTEFQLKQEMLDFLLLRRARGALSLSWTTPEPNPLPALTQEDWDEISHAWHEVIDMQHAQGGQTTFVYIPAIWRFLAEDPAPFEALERKVVTLWSDLGADSVTLSEPLDALANPLSYYNGHFNEAGYRLTAEIIVKHLSRAPSPSERGQARPDASCIFCTQPAGSRWRQARS